MKLNNRVWLVIVPVIIVAYSAALFLVYQTQKKSFLQLEQSRLEAQLSRLRDAFDHDKQRLNSLFTTVRESPALQEVLVGSSAELSAHVTERHLRKFIDNILTEAGSHLEIVASDSAGAILYHYSSSTDPFVTASQPLLVLQNRILRGKKESAEIQQTEGDNFEGIKAASLDPLTMKVPSGDRWNDAVAFGIVTSFNHLNNTLNQIKDSHSYIVSQDESTASEEVDMVSGALTLGQSLTISLIRNPEHIQDTLTTLVLRLSLIVFALTCFTSVLLGGLIQRFITDPIVALELSLNELDGFTPAKTLSNGDEVAALTRTIFELNKQRAEAYENIKLLAETDTLTKLYNRRMFVECVEGVLKRARDTDQIALLYIDLDNFKYINDNYGHDMGDQVLKEFAVHLQSVLRLTDVVMSVKQDISRLAGDEFAVIIHGCKAEVGLPSIADRILNIFSQGFQGRAANFPISASIGIAVFPEDGKDATSLITNADAAMYQAKQHGRNRYAFFSKELAERALRQQRIEANLKMKHFDEFSMYYMPLINARDGAICGVEALIRWHSKELGFVSPAEFIPIAESKGLFLDLDIWVLNKVFDDLPVLVNALGPNAKVAINISSAQLGENEFFYELMTLITQRKIDRHNLELEITETYGASISDRAIASLDLFKQAGFTLALDDFGSGYTSFLQLMEYPVDVIKIDKAIVDRLLSDGAQLVEALVAFCKKQGFSVTAEGIEHAEQADILRKVGVDIFQGFYFFKPQPLSQLLQTVDNHNQSSCLQLINIDINLGPTNKKR